MIEDHYKSEKLYKAESVAFYLDISLQTLNYWYAWKRANPDNERAEMLPKYMQRGKKGTRYWRKEDIQTLKKFRDTVIIGRNGIMGSTTQKYTKKKGRKRNEKKS